MDLNLKQYEGDYHKTRFGSKFIRINGSEAAVSANCGYYPIESLFQHRLAIKQNPLLIEEYKDKDGEHMAEEMKLGHESEPFAIELYSKLTGYEVKHGSYFISRKFPDFFGASPDGRVFKENKFIGLLECKRCIYKMKEEIDIDHHFQMQHQLFVTEAEWVDYFKVFWETNERITHYFYVRVYRCEEFINWMIMRYTWLLDSLHEEKELPNKPFRLVQITNSSNPKPFTSPFLLSMISKIKTSKPVIERI